MKKSAKPLTVIFFGLFIFFLVLTFGKFNIVFLVAMSLFLVLSIIFWLVGSLHSIRGNKMAVRSILGRELTEHMGPKLLFVPLFLPATYIQEYLTEVKIFDFPEHTIDTKSTEDPTTGEVLIGREKIKINTNLVITIPRAGTGGLIKFHQADLSGEDDKLKEWSGGVLLTFYVSVASELTYVEVSKMSTSDLQKKVDEQIKISSDDELGLLGLPGFKPTNFIARIQEATLPPLIEEEMKAINKATLEKSRLERDKDNILYKQETEKEQKEIEAKQKAEVEKIKVQMDKILAATNAEIKIIEAEAGKKTAILTSEARQKEQQLLIAGLFKDITEGLAPLNLPPDSLAEMMQKVVSDKMFLADNAVKKIIIEAGGVSKNGTSDSSQIEKTIGGLIEKAVEGKITLDAALETLKGLFTANNNEIKKEDDTSRRDFQGKDPDIIAGILKRRATRNK